MSMRRSVTSVTVAFALAAGSFYESIGEKKRQTPNDVLVVYPRDPYADWARALKVYMMRKYGVHVVLEELSANDPDEDGVMCKAHSGRFVVIPMQVEVTKKLAENRVRHSLLCPDASIYTKLDNKAVMSTLLENNGFLPQIPTLDVCKSDASELKAFVHDHRTFNRFILKPNEGAGSAHQRVLSRNDVTEHLVPIVRRGLWDKPTVMQPLIENHRTIEFNFLAIEGKVVAHLCTISPSGGISEKMWEDGCFLYKHEDPHDLRRILALVENVAETNRLSGLMEFEFLKVEYDEENNVDDKSSCDLYLLEVNPRISSSVVAFDPDSGDLPYVDQLLVPYLRSFGIDVESDANSEQTCRAFWFPPETTAYAYALGKWSVDS